MEVEEQADGRNQLRPQANGGLPTTDPRRVLVADDQPHLRMLCRISLEAAGIKVAEASDGDEALEAARAWRPDAVLLDITMPGMNGWDVADTLLGDDERTCPAIIFFSAHASVETRSQALSLGGIAFVTKPFDPFALAPLIERLLARVDRGESAAVRREALEELRATATA
jgi:two-component system OmpR family response regulator